VTTAARNSDRSRYGEIVCGDANEVLTLKNDDSCAENHVTGVVSMDKQVIGAGITPAIVHAPSIRTCGIVSIEVREAGKIFVADVQIEILG
jgi:hypothetical protein